jgi:hypothetical protein
MSPLDPPADPAPCGAEISTQPAIAHAVPAIQRRGSRVPSMIRSHRPVLTGAMPNVIAVATAAPLRAAAVRNVPWKMAVAAEAASSAGQAALGSARNAPGSRTSMMTVSTSPPDRIRAPPIATGPAGECARISAGPTVPHRTPAARTIRIAERLFRCTGWMLWKDTEEQLSHRIPAGRAVACLLLVRLAMRYLGLYRRRFGDYRVMPSGSSDCSAGWT